MNVKRWGASSLSAPPSGPTGHTRCIQTLHVLGEHSADARIKWGKLVKIRTAATRRERCVAWHTLPQTHTLYANAVESRLRALARSLAALGWRRRGLRWKRGTQLASPRFWRTAPSDGRPCTRAPLHRFTLFAIRTEQNTAFLKLLCDGEPPGVLISRTCGFLGLGRMKPEARRFQREARVSLGEIV